MVRMNYLNHSDEMEEVCVIGYFGDSNYTSSTHIECYQEDRGYFVVPFTRLFVSSQTTKDILDMCAEQEKLHEIIYKVVNKGE